MTALTDRLNAHLKTLRKADTQAQAVAWMTAAYRLMEEAIGELERKPEISTTERVIFLPTEQRIEVIRQIEIVQVLPVVYRCPAPPTAKAWTHRDTLRLEQRSH